MTVYLEGKNGFIKWMPSRVAGKRNGAIEVFNSKDIEMNEGEKIRWTRNNAKRGITNNEMGENLKITNKAILIKSETGLTQSFGKNDPQLKYLNYAYSSTTHAAQGKTLNKLIAVMESARPALTNNKSFYVTISRPKYQVELITDNVQRLQKTIERHTGESISALDHSKEISPEEKTQSTSKEHEVTSQKHLNNETEKQQESEMKINREIELTM